MRKSENHEADIENVNLGTSGRNIANKKNVDNRARQLKLEAEKKRLKEKQERDKRANELNPNNPNYKGKKKIET